MSFGLKTYGPNGEIYFDGSRRALRVIYHQTVSANFTGDISIEGINPFIAAAVCIPRTSVPFDRNLRATVGNGVVTLSRYNSSYPPKTTLDLIVFGYA